MNYISRYINYLKDNPNHYWFKRKLYGWGWVPATWQGWFALGFFLLILVAITIPFGKNPQPTNTETIWFVAEVVVWAAAVVVTCWITGEKPRWQWGLPKDK